MTHVLRLVSDGCGLMQISASWGDAPVESDDVLEASGFDNLKRGAETRIRPTENRWKHKYTCSTTWEITPDLYGFMKSATLRYWRKHASRRFLDAIDVHDLDLNASKLSRGRAWWETACKTISEDVQNAIYRRSRSRKRIKTIDRYMGLARRTRRVLNVITGSSREYPEKRAQHPRKRLEKRERSSKKEIDFKASKAFRETEKKSGWIT